MSPTATSPPQGAPSSSPIRQGMSSTPATWPPAPPPRNWRSSWWTPPRDCWRRQGGIPTSPPCWAYGTSCWRSTRWTWSAPIRPSSRISSHPTAKPPEGSISSRSSVFRFAPGMATTSPRAPRACPGTTVRSCSTIWRRYRSYPSIPMSYRSASRCNGSIVRTGIFAAMPAWSPAARSPPATPSRCCPAASAAGSRGSSPPMATWNGRSPASRSP